MRKDPRENWKLPEELAAAIKEIAKRDNRTIVGTLRHLVKLYNEGKLK